MNTWILLLALLLTGHVMASEPRRSLTPVRDSEMDLTRTIRQACALGNLSTSTSYHPMFIIGEETYAYVFDPTDTCDCLIGVRVDYIHMILRLRYESLPTSFYSHVTVNVLEWDDVRECWIPGEAVCTSDVEWFTFFDPGYVDIGLPLTDCDCLSTGYRYALSYVFGYFSSTAQDLVVDESPTECTSWLNEGFGWSDLIVDWNTSGDTMIWADADCCSEPVANTQTTWGSLKRAYR